MFVPINPQNEERRAQAILSSFTDQQNAVNLFAPSGSQGRTTEPVVNANRNSGLSITRLFKAVKLNRQPVADETGTVVSIGQIDRVVG